LSLDHTAQPVFIVFHFFVFSSLQLSLANPGPAVIDKLHASMLTELIGGDKIFLTVADAVVTCAPKVVVDEP